MRGLLVAMVAVLMKAGAASAADQPIVIKFSHVTTRDTPKGRSAEKFKECGSQDQRPGKGRVLPQ